MTSTTTRLRPWQILAATVLLTGAALLAYWPALTGGFLWDDDTLVTDSTLRSVGPALARHFVAAEVKAFDYGQRDEALAWLRAA